MFEGAGFGVEGLGFGGLWLRVQDVRVYGLGFALHAHPPHPRARISPILFSLANPNQPRKCQLASPMQIGTNHTAGHKKSFGQILCKKLLNYNFDSEVYYTNHLILLVKNMLCNKLHCKKFSNQKPFHVRFRPSIG